MYRVQLGGNQYERNREVGLHYQIHRGIGVHHAAALELKKPLRVNVFVGGPPAMTVAAVMPLPEGMSELAFAGALGGRRVPMVTVGEKLPIHAEADFCISGYIDPGRQLPEGPFGDHLGYYSLAHDFPVMIVERVYHRKDAIWPFTVVGRPPQEDSMFGELIHELVEPVMPGTIPGVRAVHAVEAAGVHPLLLAIGSERYVPYEGRRVTCDSSAEMFALVVAMFELICVRWYWAASYCWLNADISFCAWLSCDSMAAALALASEMASPAAGRAKPSTVLANTVTTVNAGMPTRWSTCALLGDRGVEWLKSRSTSVTIRPFL